MKLNIKIILTDDHRIFRDGIKSLLSENEDIQIVGEASDGYELLEMLKVNTPDIVIMDISMPKISGIEVAKHISALYPEVGILIY